MIERAMVVTAHPDDAETGAGGTVARLVRQGVEITYVIVTSGNMGSSDRTMTPDRLARIREAEQRNAAHTLGVKHVEFLGYDDGEVEETRDLRRDITRQIRKWRPDLIIAQSPHRTPNVSAPTETTASRAGLCSIVSTLSPAITGPFRGYYLPTSRTR
jgi:LmbE family N-acetylglucosaminyl deacetylase